jgi:hypothetical protein
MAKKSIAELEAQNQRLGEEIERMKEKRRRDRQWITEHGGDWKQIERGEA